MFTFLMGMMGGATLGLVVMSLMVMAKQCNGD